VWGIENHDLVDVHIHYVEDRQISQHCPTTASACNHKTGNGFTGYSYDIWVPIIYVDCVVDHTLPHEIGHIEHEGHADWRWCSQEFWGAMHDALPPGGGR
jgi:hypothetical protein